MDRPTDAVKIPRTEFDRLARAKQFDAGPWVSSFGDDRGDPYVPPAMRSVWGRLADGRAVWADQD